MVFYYIECFLKPLLAQIKNYHIFISPYFYYVTSEVPKIEPRTINTFVHIIVKLDVEHIIQAHHI